MIHNEGTIDRGIRIGLGLALLAMGFISPYVWIGLLGLVPLATGLAGYCPLYRALHIRTRPVDRLNTRDPAARAG